VSTPIAIHTEHLGKTIGRGEQRVRAVDDLCLRVPSGLVYGFLGPNGAGKTTTIRMLLDLVRPTEGKAYILGHNVHEHPQALRRVGALVEHAAFYPFMSGRDNLEVLARTANNHTPRRIVELLEQVGLSQHASRRVRDYSTGMRQRLGIAAALLGDPDLVILDEPTNGLDPAGIHGMRNFVRDLAHIHGKTVFLSSHLLGEVEQICDRVAIIHRGRLMAEGAVTEFLTDGAQLRVLASPQDKALAVLKEDWPAAVHGTWLVVRASTRDSPRLVRQLISHDVDVYQVVVQQRSLEEKYLAVTRGQPQEESDV